MADKGFQMRNLRLLVWFVLFWLSSLSYAKELLREQQEGVAVVLEQLVEGLGIPWGMAFVDAHQLLVSERQGRLLLIDTRTGMQSSVAGVPPVFASGQGGLLDVAVPPDYQPGGWVYFSYSKSLAGKGVTALARAQLHPLNGASTRLSKWQELLLTRSATSTSHHFGSRIAFDNQDHLFVSVGDRGERPNGQDLSNHAGSILRLYRDGRVPSDNPFVDRADVLDEIWSYGHRNPQGLAYDLKHQRLWEIEHGPRGGDEINLIQRGRNYGWPIISFGKEYWGPVSVGEGTHKEGMEAPVKVYIPSIAPGSLVLYNGDAFPAWRGSLFAGALKLAHLNQIVLDENGLPLKELRWFESLNERIRALAQSPEGWLYLSTDSGKILRARPE